MVFKTTSQGGRSAIAELLTKYDFRLDIGKGGSPVVELGATLVRAPASFGNVSKPQLRIVRWLEEDDLPNDGGPSDGRFPCGRCRRGAR